MTVSTKSKRVSKRTTPKVQRDLKRILVLFIQDRSGSMSTNWIETLGGFRAFVEELRLKDDIDYRFSLTVFDDRVDNVLTAVPLKDVKIEILAKYPPRGMTSLFDAVADTIQANATMATEVEKVICIIATDGENNASHKWGKDSLHTLIDSKLREGNWTFQYFGTQPETWADAANIGLGNATVGYSVLNAPAVYAAAASAINNFSVSALRSAGCTLTTSYADSDKLIQAKLVTPTSDQDS